MAVIQTIFLHGGNWQEAASIEISVVLSGLLKYRNNANAEQLLAQQCLTLLLNRSVKTGENLTLETSSLAKMYGINRIIINTCKPKYTNDSTENITVSRKTKLSVSSVQSAAFYKLKSASTATKLGGLDEETRKLCQLVALSKSRRISSHQTPIGVLLHGPPGCGKTSLAKAVAHFSGSVFLCVEGTDLLQFDFGSGADAVKQIFRQAEELSWEGSVVLFIDEIETLCPGHDNASLGSKQISSALVSEMDRLANAKIPSILVIAATNTVSLVHKGLRRPGRFDSEVLISVPSKEQRMSILEHATSGMFLDTDVYLPELASKTPGYVGADLNALCEEAALQAAGNDERENGRVSMSDFTHALHTVIPSLRKGLGCQIDVQPVKWEDIGGLQEIKDDIRQSIEWPLLHPESLKRLDIAATKGVLLYGPPGCCKTTLVRAAATSCNVTFLSLNGAQVYSPYVGESERIISETFQKARALSPSILFLDEIDSLVGKRSSSSGKQSRVQERILTTMLNEMDGVGIRLDEKSTSLEKSSASLDQRMKPEDVGSGVSEPQIERKAGNQVIVIGATNRPDMLDAALLRPGRLDRHIFVPPPDTEGRKSILKVFTSKMKTEILDVNSLCEKTELFSGADLANLCREAGLIAVREAMSASNFDVDQLRVTQQHFVSALNTIKPSLSPNCLKLYAKNESVR